MFTPNYPPTTDSRHPIPTPNGHPVHHAVLPILARTGALPEFTGRGVVMAFIDSGFYPHPDLGSRIRLHVDASTAHIVEGANFRRPRPHSWHGQMTSVIAAGDGRTSGGRYRGIASEAQLVLIRVSTPTGHVKEADILRGLDWVRANGIRYGIRVVNVSVGGDFESDDPAHPLHEVVRDLVAAGIVVTIAAGNTGSVGLLPPASAAEGLIIGGVDDRNSSDVNLWQPYHNSYGTGYDGTPKPDLIANAAWIASPILPGSSMAREARWLAPMLRADDEAEVRRLLRQGFADLSIARAQAEAPDEAVFAMLQARIHAHKLIDAYHQHVDGTSVSSAVAASVVAAVLEANSRLTPADVRAILTETAKRLPDVPVERQGAGIIDAEAAVRLALATRSR